MIQPEPERSTQGYPLFSVEVLRYDKGSKSENMGIVPTEMELILEHTQQGDDDNDDEGDDGEEGNDDDDDEQDDDDVQDDDDD
nr:hypothetical protein [Tanacetum cinerariifolium]